MFKKRRSHNHGFIPIVVAILIGLGVIGAAGMAMYLEHKQVVKVEPKQEVKTLEVEVTQSAPVATSSSTATDKSTPSKPTVTTQATVDTTTPVPVQIQTQTAVNVNTPEDIKEAEREIQKEIENEKLKQDRANEWKAWQQMIKDRANGDTDQKEYDEAECKDQKKSMVKEVEDAYEEWHVDWQAARAELNSCYDTNSVPYCDSKMTRVNVEWGDKWGTTVGKYQDKLTKCSSEDRRFGDVSDMLSSY